MHRRTLRHSLVLSVAAVLAVAGTALADSVRADGDITTPEANTFIELGEVAPGATISVDVGFILVCTSTNHVDPGQTITLSLDSMSQPNGGAVVSVGDATLGPVPDSWTADGQGCPSPAPTIAGGTSTVVLRAPTAAGTGYPYSIFWRRSLSPLGNADGSVFGATTTAITFSLDVVANTPPVLTLPGDMTVEGDTTGGWTAAFSASAADAEDDPDPDPSCSPSAGDVLPLGTTTVACTVTDSGGLGDAGSFDVTVVDTTDPVLDGMPGDQALTTDDPDGTTLHYDPPTATDVVDASPDVVCSPADGDTVPVGHTFVTCTATDASGNDASDSFDVDVTFDEPEPPDDASAAWGEPVAGDSDTFVANRGRTIPVKVQLFVNGNERTSGDASLSLTPCGGGSPELILALDYGGGRWNASVDTTTLASGCYAVVASIDGLDAGGFRLELRGVESVKGKPAKTTG
jgi:hypothetical protein